MKRFLLSLIALWLLALPAQALDGDCDYTVGSTTTATGFANCALEIIEAQSRGVLATTSTNSANDIIATSVNTPVAVLRDSTTIAVDSPVTISGAANINLDGTGLKGVVFSDGTAAGSGDIVSGTRYYFSYKLATTKWVLITPAGVSSGGGTAPFLTTALTPLLVNERAYTVGTGLDTADAGAGSTFTVSLDFTEVNSVVWGDGSFTTVTFDVGATDPVFTYSSPATVALSGGGTSPLFLFDDQGELRFLEEDAGGNNYIGFKAPAAVTSDVTCTLENDSNPVPDSCVGDGSDDDVPESGDFTNLSATAPISFNTGTGTISTSMATSRLIGRTTASTGVMEEISVNATLSLSALTLGVVDVTCTDCLGPTEISDLTLGTDTAGNYVATVADGTGIDGTASSEGTTYTPTLDLTEINSTTFGSGTFTTLTFDAGATDPTWTYASNGVGLTNMATFVHGNATSLTTAGVAAQVQIDGTTGALGSLNINEFNTTDGTAFGLNFYKSGDAAIGSATVVASGEDLGRITWYGAQQTGTFGTQNQAAGIRATVGGTVTSGAAADMPGNLIFCTTADGSGTCTDRLTIDAAGLSTFAGSLTVGANNITTTNIEMANGTANTLTASGGVLSIEGVALVSTTRTLTGGTGIATIGDLSANRTVAFDYSDAGASPALNADEGRFTGDATTNGEMVFEGDTADANETRIVVTDPTADRAFTIPNADSSAIQASTCSGTDRISAVSSLGVITCSHILESFCVAASDESTAITAGTAKTTFRMPYAFTLTNIRGNLNTVSSSGSPIIDVNEAGTTLMTTNKVLIDVSEKTSVTAVTAVTLTDTSLADDAEITIDVDTAGTGAKGLKICLIGYQT